MPPHDYSASIRARIALRGILQWHAHDAGGSMRINNMVDFITKVANSKIEVNQERCVAVRNRNADCLRCAEACVSGCIRYKENELLISPLSCIGCATCCTVCPTAALDAKNPDDEQLLLFCEKAAARNGGTATIVCDKVMERFGSRIDKDKVVAVPCIGRLEESLYATLASDDIPEIVVIDALCEGCEYKNGRDIAELVRKTTQIIFDAWHCDCTLRISSKLPGSVRKGEEAYDKSLRGLFSAVKTASKEIGAEAVKAYTDDKLGNDSEQDAKGPVYIKVNEQGVLPHFVPDRRSRLIEALRCLGSPDDIMLETRLWGNVIIDSEKCRSCYMCATFCPTGAILKLIDDTGVARGVGHIPSQCVKCRTCVNICMSKAISISEEVFATDVLAGITERIDMKAQSSDVADQLGLGKGNLGAFR